MMLRGIGLFLLSLFIHIAVAQRSAIYTNLAEIEKCNTCTGSISALKKMLTTPGLSGEETLAIQTALVHQYQSMQLWDSCLHFCQSQVTLAHQQSNTLAEATFYKLMGNTYYHIPNKDKAVEYWNKCIEICEPNQYNTLLEQCYHNVGVHYLENGVQYELAENYLRRSLNMGLLNHPKTSSDNLLHARLLATLYERIDQLDKAENLYLDVINDCKEIKDTPHLAETMMFYTEVLKKKKDYQKAIQISEEALALSRKIKGLDVIITALKIHADNLFIAGNYKEAYGYEDELNRLIQQRFNGDLNIKIGEAEAKFNTAEIKHEKEVAVLKARKEKQVYLVSFFGILCAAAFVFYFLYQKRSTRQHAQLQHARMQSLLDGEEKERTRIAKDLHDGIVQDLTAIKLQLNAGLSTNGIIDKEVILHAVDFIDKASKEVRSISYQMMPATLIQLGFIPAIEDLLKRVLTPGNIKYEFEQIGINKRLPENIEVNIFRITQELLNNVIKHSEADFVSLLITLKADIITMIFEDNGKGFNEKTIKKGIGFNSLYSRVELLKGEIKYEKALESGTLAIVKLPVIF